MKSGKFCSFFMFSFWLNIIQRGWYAKFSAKWEWECCGQPMRSLRCRGPPSYWSAADAVLLFISFNAIEAKIAEQDSGSCASTKNGVILRKLYPLTKVLWLLQTHWNPSYNLKVCSFVLCSNQFVHSSLLIYKCSHSWVWNICPAEQLVLVIQGHWTWPPIASGSLI